MRSGLCSVVFLLVLVGVTSRRIDLDPFQDLILDQHNDYRREERASNMCLMKWNASLAQDAGRWADRCEFKHEVKSGLGENLAFDTRNWDTDKLLDGLMEGWHDEKRMWSYGSKPCGFACHFTQIVWHSTNTIGCAATRCPSMTGMMTTPIKNAFYLVCFYYPRGNWIGQVAYVPGRACSKCENGATCSNELCDNSGVSAAPKTAVLPAPAPLALSKRPVSRNRNPFTVLRKSSRFETFSHGVGDKRKTVTRGMSFLHQSGPQALRAPQSFTAGRNKPLALRSRQVFRSNHRDRHGDQGTQLRENQGRQLRQNRSRDMYSRVSQKENRKVQRHNKPKRRRNRRCKDRLPSCFKWADRCERNRAMKVICPKSCDACEMVLSMVDGRNKKNGHKYGHSKPEVHTGNNGRHHGNKQITSNLRQQNRQSQRHHRTQDNRQHHRQHHQRQTHTQQHQQRQTKTHQQHHQRQTHTQNHNRHHLKNKPSTHRQQNSVLPQRDDPFCSDSVAFAKRCIYWKKTGFCKGNYMMRTMYCKKSCGNC